VRRERWEVKLAGEGGQGIALAGSVLAEAALLDGKNAVMTHAYASQQRGGLSEVDVIIASGEIDHPRVLQADVMVAFSQRAFDRHHHQLGRDGWLIVDSSQLKQAVAEEEGVLPIPLAKVSREATGSILSANMVALGLTVGLTRLVSFKALMAAMRKRSPRAELQANEQALRRGMELAHSLKERKRMHR